MITKKVVARKFMSGEHVIKIQCFKFVTKERIDRETYMVNILECGHYRRIRNNAGMKAKNLSCVSCEIDEWEKE